MTFLAAEAFDLDHREALNADVLKGFLHLVEHGITDKKVVLGPAADNTGDGLTFSNPIYEATNTTQIGFDQGYCTRSIVGKSYDCTWTLIFAHSTKADDPDQVGRDRRSHIIIITY